MDVQIIHRHEEHITGRLDEIVVSYATNEPTRQMLEEAARQLPGIRERTGRRPVVIVLIKSTAPPPSDDSRAALRTYFKAIADDVAGFCLCVEGEGFLAAAKRAALSFLLVASRHPFHCRVVGTPAEAAHWLRSKLAIGRSDHEIVEAIEYLKESFERGS